jgi:hypothetical protein
MIARIVFVGVLDGHRLFLRFHDGGESVIDLADHIQFTGVFEPLLDPSFFHQVTLNPVSGTVEWPNGADLDPDVLYSIAFGVKVSV